MIQILEKKVRKDCIREMMGALLFWNEQKYC